VHPDGVELGPTFRVSLSGAEKFRGRGKCATDLDHNLLYRSWTDMILLRKRRPVVIMGCIVQCNWSSHFQPRNRLKEDKNPTEALATALRRDLTC
jgi:hypothetical protein